MWTGIVLIAILSGNEALKGKELIMEDISKGSDFNLLITDILFNFLKPYACITIICDQIFYDILQRELFNKFGVYISFIIILAEDYEDLLIPYQETTDSLIMAKTQGCQFYIILISNGIQVSRLLRYGDRYRVLNTRANFILLYDQRLFHKDLLYLWKRIVNVVFVREYGGIRKKLGGNVRSAMPWYELTTVPFPSPINEIFVPRRLDIWRQSKFRTGVDLFRDKTSDLRNQTMKVVTFQHVPATVKVEIPQFKTVKTVLIAANVGFSGIEIEILQMISKSMNFKPELYQLENADLELWGQKQSDGQISGLIGEMVKSRADLALGDLHYTSYLLKLMDLSIPYNTECLTFVTPESLFSTSWKTLILPFKGSMWGAILSFLLLIGFVFYALSRFHDEINRIVFKDLKARREALKKEMRDLARKRSKQTRMDLDQKYRILKSQYELPKIEGEPEGLYLFGNLSNSILYTYSMLLVISLPKLPTGWSIRILTGWYWLYCILVVVAYKASLTAILAKPNPRVTIDTLQQLVASKLPCGGWGEVHREFFKTSLDQNSQTIGSRFSMVNDSDQALQEVADGHFAFYESSHFLKQAIVKRQMRLQMNANNTNETKEDDATQVKNGHNLHIMTDCIIHMPISIGLQKNSPIKPRVDKFIRRVFEAGLIKKWLDDVMQTTLNAEVSPKESTKAVMNFDKFYGALVALLVGYLLSISVLIGEIVHFNFVVKKHPGFDKYSKQIIQVTEIDQKKLSTKQ